RRMRELFGGDLFPYGIEENRATWEQMALYTYQQGIAHRHMRPEEFFPAGIMTKVVISASLQTLVGQKGHAKGEGGGGKGKRWSREQAKPAFCLDPSSPIAPPPSPLFRGTKLARSFHPCEEGPCGSTSGGPSARFSTETRAGLQLA